MRKVNRFVDGPNFTAAQLQHEDLRLVVVEIEGLLATRGVVHVHIHPVAQRSLHCLRQLTNRPATILRVDLP